METSEELCKRIASESSAAICSFSMGKDSIAAAIQMLRYFERVEFVFMYAVPDLEFQETALRYYENKFGKKIKRMPSPAMYKQLNGLMYQPPANVDIIADLNLFECTYDEIFLACKHDLKISDGSYTGIGVRASDSLARRATISRFGAKNSRRKTFFPVFDWNMERLVSEIRQSGIKLPIDYKIWGRTFDGYDHRFLKPLKDNFPRDYQRILEWFPLAELELMRYENEN